MAAESLRSPQFQMRRARLSKKENRVESRADGDAAESNGEPVNIPGLVPDRPKRLPKAVPPKLVQAIHPVNPAPFLPPPVEPPITSPVKGAILPHKKPVPPPVHAPFDEIRGARYGHDRWGVPVTRREQQRALHAVARRSGVIEVSRPGRGIAVGFLVGLVTATGYGALAWALGVEYLFASIIIGLAVGWAMFRAWGRQGPWVGAAAAAIAALSFTLAVVVVVAAAAAAQDTGDVWTWLVYIVEHPGWWFEARLDARPATPYFLAVTALAAFVTAGGLGRRRMKVVHSSH